MQATSYLLRQMFEIALLQGLVGVSVGFFFQRVGGEFADGIAVGRGTKEWAMTGCLQSKYELEKDGGGPCEQATF